LADGRWHKVAWAVYTGPEGASIAEFYVDNKFRGARILKRNNIPGEINTDGVAIFGRNGFGEEFGVFEGDIQQFDLWDDANVAFRSTEMDGKMEPELTVQCDTSIGLAAETLGSEESSFASNSGLDGDSGLENYEPESFLSSESKFSYLSKYISYSLVESSMICTAES
jgi:hypothetical protein